MADLPYLRRKAQHKIGKSGRSSEKRLTKELGGRARPASGAMDGAKGDIVLGEVLMEAKSTTGNSMGVKYDWLIKIAQEARDGGKTPVLMVSFVRPNGTAFLDGEWAMIPRKLWEDTFT